MSATVRHRLEQAWLASLDADPDIWHLDPFAHLIFEIGQKFDEVEPGRLQDAIDAHLYQSVVTPGSWVDAAGPDPDDDA